MKKIKENIKVYLISNGKIISNNKISQVNEKYVTTLFEKYSIDEKIDNLIKTNFVAVKTKATKMLSKIKEEIKSQHSTYYVNLNQKIDSVDKNKAKYELRMTTGLLDTKGDDGASLGLIIRFFNDHKKVSKSIFILSFAFFISIIVAFILKYLVDKVVKMKTDKLKKQFTPQNSLNNINNGNGNNNNYEISPQILVPGI